MTRKQNTFKTRLHLGDEDSEVSDSNIMLSQEECSSEDDTEFNPAVVYQSFGDIQNKYTILNTSGSVMVYRSKRTSVDIRL